MNDSRDFENSSHYEECPVVEGADLLECVCASIDEAQLHEPWSEDQYMREVESLID